MRRVLEISRGLGWRVPVGVLLEALNASYLSRETLLYIRSTTLNIQTDRALVPAGSTAERFLAITITAPVRETKTDRPTVNVACA
jgi:hypothetical protein